MKPKPTLFQLLRLSCGSAMAALYAMHISTAMMVCHQMNRRKKAYCSMLMLLLCGTAVAQNEFDIKAQAPDLEQEYQAELDKWMLRAYEGDRDAQFKVGVLFTNNQFSKPDYEQAVYWYKQAARQGHVLAQYNLGHQYLTGVGVTKSEKTAIEWWMKAAKQDHALAQFNVGRAYYLGIGLDEDHQKSRDWFERAANNNEPKSIDILTQLGWTDANGQLAATEQMPDNEYDNQEDTNTESDSNVGTSDQLTSVITVVDSPEADLATPAASAPIVEEQAQAVTTLDETAAALAEPSIETPVTTTPSEDAAIPSLVAEESPTNNSAAITTTPEIKSTSVAPATGSLTGPIALYTNPGVRSVLIAIIDDRSSISVERQTGPWSIVRSNKGFPVWVHGDFILVDEKVGQVTGTGVNARSVPIVTNGTVVGKFKKNEWLEVVDQRDGWLRVVAPARFKAWAKTSELERIEKVAQQNTPKPALQQPATTRPAAKLTGPRPTNDNDWLFSQSPSTYTLQLASFDDPVKIKEFESRLKFINNPELHRFTANGKDIVWTYYLYGAYPSTESAKVAKSEIKQKLAWIRNFGQLQQNRCVAWKTQFPTPKELNSYCVGQ